MLSQPLSGNLLTPVALGELRLPNRLVMAPMSRLRSGPDLAPPKLVADYYAQRASAGLIITEGIMVAPYGAGFPSVPGLFTPGQVQAWRAVVEAVHGTGGRIVAQLAHVGRPRPESAAANRAPGWAMTDPVRPYELDAADLAGMLQGFADGARAAREAGFDAVEIHNGSGFLLDQMLRAGANRRTDGYGGSLENRVRLTLEILAAVIGVYGAGRVGIKLSPSATVAGKPDPDGEATFAYLLGRLSPLGLAYVHATRTTEQDRAHGSGSGVALERIRAFYQGKLVGEGDFTREEGEAAVAGGVLDAVGFGRLFLANPDLPERFARRAALNAPRPETFYTPGPVGFTDYPRLADPASES